MKLSNETKKQLIESGHEIAENLAKDARSKIEKHYKSLINRFYADYRPTTYERSGNLKNSYKRYHLHSIINSYVSAGIQIVPSSHMSDYINRKGNVFKASTLIDKYIYTKNGTFHGGNWYGNKGVPANFSIYDEMYKFQRELIKTYQ